MPHIIVDTEYTTDTGWREASWQGPGQHREIVQIAVIEVDDEFNELRSFDVLVRPKINPALSALFIELTQLAQADVDENGLEFPAALAQFHEFCVSCGATAGESGAKVSDDASREESSRLASASTRESTQNAIICMNGDGAVFRENCAIHGVGFPFSAPFHRLDPFLLAQGVEVQSSGDLHTLTKTPLTGHTHNALHDVRSMACWLKEAKANGVFRGLDQLPTTLPTFDRRARMHSA